MLPIRLNWLNLAAVGYGGQQVRYFCSHWDHDTDGGHPVDKLPKYCVGLLGVDIHTSHALNSSSEVFRCWGTAHYGAPLQVEGPKETDAMLASLGTVPRMGKDQGRYDNSPCSVITTGEGVR